MAAVLARNYPGCTRRGRSFRRSAGLAYDVFSALRLMSRGPQMVRLAPTCPLATASAMRCQHRFPRREDLTVHLSNGQAITPPLAPTRSGAFRAASLQATTHSGRRQHGLHPIGRYGVGGVTTRNCGSSRAAMPGPAAATRKPHRTPMAPTPRARCCVFLPIGGRLGRRVALQRTFPGLFTPRTGSRMIRAYRFPGE